MESWFFHADVDAFYASAEQLDDPSLRGKPVLVGGSDLKRSVVSACSYEARTYGIHSAMPMFQAIRLCPEAIVRPVRMSRYAQLSEHIMGIFRDFSPTVEQISIDEAFLEMSGTERLFGPIEKSAQRLQRRVLEEVGLTISIGIASNRLVAKMASEQRKPFGIFTVRQNREEQFVSSLELKDLFGIGKRGREELAKRGITTVQALQRQSIEMLCKGFGEATGLYYYHVSRGIDPGIYSGQVKSRSVSNEVTLNENTTDEHLIRSTLFDLSLQLTFRLLEASQKARTVAIKLKYDDFTSCSCQCSLKEPVANSSELYSIACDLFESKYQKGRAVRLVGLSLSSITAESEELQRGLFEKEQQKEYRVERTVLNLREKGNRIMKASQLLRSNHHTKKGE